MAQQDLGAMRDHGEIERICQSVIDSHQEEVSLVGGGVWLKSRLGANASPELGEFSLRGDGTLSQKACLRRERLSGEEESLLPSSNKRRSVVV